MASDEIAVSNLQGRTWDWVPKDSMFVFRCEGNHESVRQLVWHGARGLKFQPVSLIIQRYFYSKKSLNQYSPQSCHGKYHSCTFGKPALAILIYAGAGSGNVCVLKSLVVCFENSQMSVCGASKEKSLCSRPENLKLC